MLSKSWQDLQIFLVLLIDPSVFAGQLGWTVRIKVNPDKRFQITNGVGIGVSGHWFSHKQKPSPRCRIWKCLSSWIDAEGRNISLPFHSEGWLLPGLRVVTDPLLG